MFRGAVACGVGDKPSRVFGGVAVRCIGSSRMQRTGTGGGDKTSGTADVFSGLAPSGVVLRWLGGDLLRALRTCTVKCDGSGRLRRIVMDGKKISSVFDLLRGIWAYSAVQRLISASCALGCGAAQ